MVARRRRNMLFLLIDALRADKCWGNSKTAKTQTIDALCRRGTVFTQAIAATTTTTPSVASILTGTYPPRHGIRSLIGYKLAKNLKTMPEIFQESGYHTYAEVNGPLVPEIGLDRGFDEYHCRKASDNAYSKWGDRLVRRFEDAEFESPWFVFLHFFELHHPIALPKRFNKADFGANRYERAISALDTYLKTLLDNIGGETIIVMCSDHGEKIGESLMEERFLRVKQRVWRVIGKVGLRKDGTLRALGHGYHVYDELIRVPLVIAGSELFPENMIINSQISHVDILPTLVDSLRLDIQGGFRPDGRSLIPLIRSQKMEEIPIFCEACGAVIPDPSKWLVGIRTSKYKFIYAPHNEERQEELYDLKEDPKETRNIKKERPELAQKLKGILELRREHYRLYAAGVTKNFTS